MNQENCDLLNLLYALHRNDDQFIKAVLSYAVTWSGLKPRRNEAMSQIKEKAPAAPASVTSANLDNQVKDTTKRLIRQVEPVNFNLEGESNIKSRENQNELLPS